MKNDRVKRGVVMAMVISMAAALVLGGCGKKEGADSADNAPATPHNPATEQTKAANEEWYEKLDFNDRSEWENANRGLIEAPEELELISEEDGHVIWSQKAYSFLDGQEKAPDTVNPSLWENVKNNHVCGLFEVTDGIYQVRGFDMANITFIEGNTGWIIFDTSMGRECAEAAKQLVDKNLGEKPIKAVLISHSHIDHFGGVRAFVNEEEMADPELSLQEQADSGKIPVIVPEGFTEHAVAENLYAGGAMSRRAGYQYGNYLPKEETGAMSIGIGMGQSKGNATFVLPTYEVKNTEEKVTIDGVEIEFQLTPGTEAPAEMNAYFPQKRALWMAENCTGTLHNLYTLRGAEVRDGNAWAEYIMEAVSLYADKTDVVFQSHNWPHWGTDVIKDYMINTAAVYKYINDETLSLLNEGYTSTEIADMIRLPEPLEKNWYTRQYYGTLKHDAKAVYQKYMGWYDANPINLDKLTPEESAKKWAEYLELGGIDKAMKKAHEEYDEGNYQWVAEFTNTLVFADPENTEARNLCADAMEQLGYQAESGTWRNCYLTAALELRDGNQAAKAAGNSQFAKDIMVNLTPEMAFDYMGIMMDKSKIENENYTIVFDILDTYEVYTVYIRYGTVMYAKYAPEGDGDVKVQCLSKQILQLISGAGDEFIRNTQISGDTAKFEEFAKNLSGSTGGSRGTFNIIEP